MKTSTILTILAIIATCILAVACGFLNIVSDHAAPDIAIPQTQAAYREGDPFDSLLDGVTAEDARDGDVTETLRIESVMPSGDDTAMVVYIAKDNSNNMAEASRTVRYVTRGNAMPDMSALAVEETDEAGGTDTDEAGSAETDADAGTADSTASATTSNEEESEEASTGDDEGAVSTNNTTNNGTTSSTGSSEDGRAANEEKIRQLSDNAPRLYLTEYEIELERGATFHAFNYLDTITDDKDSYNELSRRVSINGEVDTSKRGTYDVQYFATDLDGNRSNIAVLEVSVA